jgi:hypothetical protein
LTFEDKRKRAKLVVISATKLNGDHATDNGDNDDDDGGEEEDAGAPLGDTVHKESNGRGRVQCTRL